jgi:CheY-like chemotaxis protein
MDKQGRPKLHVLIRGQQDNFNHILAANVQCWGYEVTILPTMAAQDEVEGDVLLYDLDAAFRFSAWWEGYDAKTPISLVSSFPNDMLQRGEEHWPRARLTIALSSHSVPRTTLEDIGAIALLQKPFEMSRLQHYLYVFQRLLLEPAQTWPCGEKIRVLVVDDDVAVAEAIRQCLILEAGYEVAVAHDGLEALLYCLDWRPHCIVADLIMPWMNGYQVMRSLAARSQETQPAFIIMSALTPLEMPVNRPYLQGKVVVYINKPFNIDHLLATIEQVCITIVSSCY